MMSLLLLLAAANPLLITEAEVPAKPIPFADVRPEHIGPAIEVHLAEARRRFAAWKARQAPYTFDNTVAEFFRLDRNLAFAVTVARTIDSTATTPEFQKAISAALPAATTFRQSMFMDPDAAARLKAFAASPAGKDLTGADKRLLEVTLDGFRRSGATLPPERRARLEEINRELQRLSLQYGTNITRATAAWEYYVTDEKDMSGVPAWLKESARADAAKRGKEGWRLTLQSPVLTAILSQADNASLRRRMQAAQATLASEVNTPVADRQIALRSERAKLLGYASHADYQTEDRMAGSGANVLRFLSTLENAARPAAERDLAELQAFRRELEGDSAPALQSWDVAYYANKYSKKVNGVEQEMLRPYFPLPRVMDGLFQFVKRMHGVEFTKLENRQVLDPNVEYYRVTRAGQDIAYVYMDLFPRDSKRGGAWQSSMITGFPGRPHVGGIFANLTPPSNGRPALLTHRQVETLFHEMGHFLHQALSRVPHSAIGGTNVAWDFVELPSQLMENFLYEKETLQSISGHYETGERLPDALFEGVRKSRTFRGGTRLLGMAGQSTMDILLHSEYKSDDAPGGLRQYARRIYDRFMTVKPIDEANPVGAFSHLFSGAYSAGYYSYLWSDMLDSDAYTRFRGNLEEASRQFREKILERGNSAPASGIYRDFAGSDPAPTSLLRKYGVPAQ